MRTFCVGEGPAESFSAARGEQIGGIMARPRTCRADEWYMGRTGVYTWMRGVVESIGGNAVPGDPEVQDASRRACQTSACVISESTSRNRGLDAGLFLECSKNLGMFPDPLDVAIMARWAAGGVCERLDDDLLSALSHVDEALLDERARHLEQLERPVFLDWSDDLDYAMPGGRAVPHGALACAMEGLLLIDFVYDNGARDCAPATAGMAAHGCHPFWGLSADRCILDLEGAPLKSLRAAVARPAGDECTENPSKEDVDRVCLVVASLLYLSCRGIRARPDASPGPGAPARKKRTRRRSGPATEFRQTGLPAGVEPQDAVLFVTRAIGDIGTSGERAGAPSLPSPGTAEGSEGAASHEATVARPTGRPAERVDCVRASQDAAPETASAAAPSEEKRPIGSIRRRATSDEARATADSFVDRICEVVPGFRFEAMRGMREGRPDDPLTHIAPGRQADGGHGSWPPRIDDPGLVPRVLARDGYRTAYARWCAGGRASWRYDRDDIDRVGCIQLCNEAFMMLLAEIPGCAYIEAPLSGFRTRSPAKADGFFVWPEDTTLRFLFTWNEGVCGMLGFSVGFLEGQAHPIFDVCEGFGHVEDCKALVAYASLLALDALLFDGVSRCAPRRDTPARPKRERKPSRRGCARRRSGRCGAGEVADAGKAKRAAPTLPASAAACGGETVLARPACSDTRVSPESREALERIRELEAIVAEKDRALGAARHSIRELTRANASLRDRARTQAPRQGSIAALTHIPTCVTDVLDLACAAWPDRIRMLDEAYDSAREFEGKVALDEVWAVLSSMATTLWELYFASTERVDIASVFRDASGFELAIHESQGTRDNRRLNRLRQRVYDGRTIDVSRHVKGRRSRQGASLRVHFCPDERSRLIIVGHCGGHLATAGTRRRSLS